jgi:hypothetical protein
VCCNDTADQICTACWLLTQCGTPKHDTPCSAQNHHHYYILCIIMGHKVP